MTRGVEFEAISANAPETFDHREQFAVSEEAQTGVYWGVIVCDALQVLFCGAFQETEKLLSVMVVWEELSGGVGLSPVPFAESKSRIRSEGLLELERRDSAMYAAERISRIPREYSSSRRMNPFFSFKAGHFYP
ncbi:hypothetical protein H0N99_03720 [Candidatus Micrarchaeota archaeon]|nr:hypothetical protein [Candidatus Micrarchaeota archaeon]